MIHNAWHFQFKFGFCVYGGMAKFRVSVAHTLMRRYVNGDKLLSFNVGRMQEQSKAALTSKLF